MLFYQIQVITPAVETQDGDLVVPFHYRHTPLCLEQVNIFWHELHSKGVSDVFFFSRLSNSSINLSPDQLFWVGVAECLVARSSVSPRLTEIGTCGFSYASSVVISVRCVCRGTIRNHRRWLWGKFSFPVLAESLGNLGLLSSISR